jgi:hypothetical protein
VHKFCRPLSSSLATIALAALLAMLERDVAVRAADNTFNIDLVSPPISSGAQPAETNPVPRSQRPNNSSFQYGDVWGEGIYAYVGSDRPEGGVYIFDISDPQNPDYLSTYFPANLGGPGSLPPGGELEDVEVYNGVAYVGSDVDNSDLANYSRTGVDIVDVSNPFLPTRMARISTTTGFPQAHDKVHTLSVNNGFLYTADNQTDVIKVFNVANPASPVYVDSFDLGLPSGVGTHEVYARDDKLFVASKYTSGTTPDGWTHIFDVSNVGATGFDNPLSTTNTGRGTHTASVSNDGKLMVVAQERLGGVVKIFDIANPAAPVQLGPDLTKPSGASGDATGPHHPHIHNDLLFISWYEAGLQVYNILNPANPVLVGSFDTYPGSSSSFNGNWGVFPFLGFDRVLLSDRDKGLLIVDITDIPAPTPDFNFDANVDGLDFLQWQRGFGIASGADETQGDGNIDGKVDGNDLAYWAESFGETGHLHAVPALVAVPEASTLTMALAVLQLLARRQARHTFSDRAAKDARSRVC